MILCSQSSQLHSTMQHGFLLAQGMCPTPPTVSDESTGHVGRVVEELLIMFESKLLP